MYDGWLMNRFTYTNQYAATQPGMIVITSISGRFGDGSWHWVYHIWISLKIEKDRIIMFYRFTCNSEVCSSFGHMLSYKLTNGYSNCKSLRLAVTEALIFLACSMLTVDVQRGYRLSPGPSPIKSRPTLLLGLLIVSHSGWVLHYPFLFVGYNNLIWLVVWNIFYFP